MKRIVAIALSALLLSSPGLLAQDQPPAIEPQPPDVLPGQPGGGPGVPPGFPGGQQKDYKELVANLIENLDDSDPETRQSIAAALAKIGKQAVPPLLAILKDKDKSAALRANAAYVLGQIGPQAGEALPELTKALKEKDKELKKRVAYAISNIVQNDPYGMGIPGIAFPGGGPGGVGGIGGVPPRLKPMDPGILPPGSTPAPQPDKAPPPDKK